MLPLSSDRLVRGSHHIISSLHRTIYLPFFIPTLLFTFLYFSPFFLCYFIIIWFIWHSLFHHLTHERSRLPTFLYSLSVLPISLLIPCYPLNLVLCCPTEYISIYLFMAPSSPLTLLSPPYTIFSPPRPSLLSPPIPLFPPHSYLLSTPLPPLSPLPTTPLLQMTSRWS